MQKLYIIFKNHIISYPTSINLNVNWCYGFVLGFFLVIQIITGLLLAAQYVSDSSFAFENIEHIMRNVQYGWLLRYLHVNGASFFFIMLYMHVLKAIYYKSYLVPRQHVWFSGILILFVSIITAFAGYVLPWGQMSYWAATVITNLVTAIPFIGSKLVIWIWGDFAVGAVTLKKFFMLHFLLPFVIVALVLLHLTLLHNSKQNDPFLTIKHNSNFLPFYPYFFWKDFFVFLVVCVFFIFITFFYPNLLNHPDNFIKANPLVTPTHIVPEWYFLVFYAILRSIPDKLLGVIAMILAILGLALLPLLDLQLYKRSAFSSNYHNYLFSYFLFIVIGLSWIGSLPVEEPFLTVGRLFTIGYFFFFFIFFFSYYFNFKDGNKDSKKKKMKKMEKRKNYLV